MFRNPEFQSLSIMIHEIDAMPNGDAIQQTLARMTGQRTVPSVWISGNFLGGSDDTLRAYNNGKLQSMLGVAK